MEAIYSEDKCGVTLEVRYDEYVAESPRDWDNLGTMLCVDHRNYTLGDEETNDFSIIDREDVISLPVYMYDHSGVVLNTTGFSCPWDSGQVGYIYVTYEDIRENYGCKYVTKAIREKVLDALFGEVSLYSSYLNGETYGYVIKDKDDILDSCWGFVGDMDSCKESGLEQLEYFAVEKFNGSAMLQGA